MDGSVVADKTYSLYKGNKSFFYQYSVDWMVVMIKQSEQIPQILVIEDDLEFGEDLCKTLVNKGYRVLSATNGNEGFYMYQDNPVDLVITDILMPEKDGVEMILDLKKCFPDVKIIAISGGGKGGTGQEYLQSTRFVCSVEHTLAKPFGRDKLFQTIQEVLRK